MNRLQKDGKDAAASWNHGLWKSEGAGEILQITTGIPYQGRVVYVKEEQAEEAKTDCRLGEKGEFPELPEHSPIRQKQELQL